MKPSKVTKQTNRQFW